MRYFALFISSISSLILILNLNGKVLGAGSTNNHPIPGVSISLELCVENIPLSEQGGEFVCYYHEGRIKIIPFKTIEGRKKFEKQLVIKEIDFVGFTME